MALSLNIWVNSFCNMYSIVLKLLNLKHADFNYVHAAV